MRCCAALGGKASNTAGVPQRTFQRTARVRDNTIGEWPILAHFISDWRGLSIEAQYIYPIPSQYRWKAINLCFYDLP